MKTKAEKINILYIFGGERAQGAEIVIERLMAYDTAHIQAFLLIAPGTFSDKLLAGNKPYQIIVSPYLKKLNRSSSSKFGFLTGALKNHIKLFFKIWSCIRKYDIDLVHANTIVPAVYALPLIPVTAVFKPGLKWVWSDHDMQYYSKLEIKLSRMCSKWYDATLVVSNAVKNKYQQQNKIEVMYNGLDVSVFRCNELLRKQFRLKHGLDKDVVVLGMAASICPGKGQLGLIQAVKQLKDKNINCRLLLAGTYAQDDDDYNEKVRQEIESVEGITYIGYLDDVISFYNGCDIIVSNSTAARSESLGTSIYEAMACETLVVASATGGTPEIISNGQDGFLFEPDNEEELVATLNTAISSKILYPNMRRAGRRKVKNTFSIPKMANRYNELIYKFIKN